MKFQSLGNCQEILDSSGMDSKEIRNGVVKKGYVQIVPPLAY